MRSRGWGVLALGSLAFTACDNSGPTGTGRDGASFELVSQPSGPPTNGEQIIVCKVGGAGTYNFTSSVGSANFSLTPGQCWRVGFFGGAGVSATITEVPRPGHEVVSIEVNQLNAADQTVTGTNTVSGVLASGAPIESAVVTFTNSVVLTGCTPGYWKQSQHFDSWVGYTPGQTAGSVFNVGAFTSLGSKTLVQTLDGSGGSTLTGAATILLRAAVAALLNSTSPDVAYPRTTAEIIAAVNTALASNDRATILALATALDADNNLTCLLN